QGGAQRAPVPARRAATTGLRSPRAPLPRPTKVHLPPAVPPASASLAGFGARAGWPRTDGEQRLDSRHERGGAARAVSYRIGATSGVFIAEEAGDRLRFWRFLQGRM